MDQNSKYSEIFTPLLSSQLQKIREKKGRYNGETLKFVEICGKIGKIEKNNFAADIPISDHTGCTKVTSYYLNNKDIFFGLPQDIPEKSYVKAFCLTRIEENRVSLILKKLKVIDSRSEIDEFLAEVLIFQLKPVGSELKDEVLKILKGFGKNGMNAEVVQGNLGGYFSLVNIEKALIKLVDEGVVGYGQDFDSYCI